MSKVIDNFEKKNIINENNNSSVVFENVNNDNHYSEKNKKKEVNIFENIFDKADIQNFEKIKKIEIEKSTQFLNIFFNSSVVDPPNIFEFFFKFFF
jgi:hypothetical protein